MATPCIESTEGFLFWTDFWFKMLLTFKASMPLLANLTFRNGAVPCFCRFTDPDSFEKPV